MKKFVVLVLALVFGLVGCRTDINVHCANTEDNCNVVLINPCPGCEVIDDFITINLSQDSPSGYVAPGERTLAVFTVSTNESTELYGLDLDVVDNYNDPIDYGLVDEVWIEDQNGNVIYDPKNITEGYNFWGVYQLPAGKTDLVVKGHVAFGEPYDKEWDPRPWVQVQLYDVYAEKPIDYSLPLYGNSLIVKYAGQNEAQITLANDSPGGIFFEGYTYTLYKFSLQADQGDYYFGNPYFEITGFDGEVTGCTFWEDNYLLSDQAKTFYYIDNNPVLSFSGPTRLLIGTTPRNFSLVCQVNANEDHQNVNVRFIGGMWETGPSGMLTYVSNGPWGNWFEFIKQEVFQLSLDPGYVVIKEIVPGLNQTLMKFRAQTSAGQAEVYTVGFFFHNWFTGDYTNCRLQDSLGNVISQGTSGFAPPYTNDLYLTFFFGPMTGIYPGAGNTYVVGETQQEISLVCDAGYVQNHVLGIDLTFVSLYTESTHNYKIMPDTQPLLNTAVWMP